MATARQFGGDDASPAQNVLNGIHVLVVEDHLDSLTLMSLYLEQHGAIVSGAPSADEAVALFIRVRPDLLVSDIGLPDPESGYSLIRRVRTLERWLGVRVPAVAVTGYAREQDISRALEAGYERCFVKPFELEDLVKTSALLVGRA